MRNSLEEVNEIENCLNSGYYEKVLLIIKEIENIRKKDFELDSIIELSEFRCKLKLNQIEKDSIASLYSDSVSNQKFGIAALCLYAIFCLPETSDDRKFEIINEMKQLYLQNNNEIAIIDIILLFMYLNIEDYNSAISISETAPPCIKIIQVFIYCIMNRFDFAQNLLDDLLENYDSYITDIETNASYSDFKESCIVRIASAWLQCIKGEYNSSFITYANLQTDFGENSSIKLPINSRNTQSIIILNGISVVHMQRQHWNDAYELLQIAYKINPKCQFTLSNLITCSYFLNLKDDSQRYIEELTSVDINHYKVVCVESIDRIFKNFHN